MCDVGLPCIADCEFKPVRIARDSTIHILEGAVADITRSRKPLHIPPSIPIQVEVNAAKGTFRAPARCDREPHFVTVNTSLSEGAISTVSKVIRILHLEGPYILMQMQRRRGSLDKLSHLQLLRLWP